MTVNLLTVILRSMLTTPHVLVGFVIVKFFPHPLGALILAFLSHFILDFFIPHWNPHLYTEFKKNHKISHFSLKIIFLDSFLALTLFLILAFRTLPDWNQLFYYGLAAFFASLPDLIEIPYYFFNCKNKALLRYVNFEHTHQANGTFFWGMLTQVLVVIASLKQLF